MSQDFKKVLVLDDRLRVRSDVDFAVFKGASSKVQHVATAQSASASQVGFNIQVPSELTIIDREMTLEGTVSLSISGIPTAGRYLVEYGSGHALCPFPLQSMFSTSNAGINNTQVSQNTQELIAAIGRFHDKRYLSRYNGMAPLAQDTYQSYVDAQGALNNPLGSYNNVSDNDLLPRGCFPVDISGNTVGDGSSSKTVILTYTVREPLLLSPFIYADPEKENQGFYGIQGLNFTFNIGSVQNILRGVDNSTAGYTISLVPPSNSDFKLYMNFLTAPNSVLLPPRNIVPYYELPRNSSSVGAIIAGNDYTITSPSLQLNQIPDKLIVFVRKRSRGFTDADCFLPIKNINITFNTVAGLLAGSSQFDLWKMSVKSGSNQSWLEFSGSANSYDPVSYTGNAQSVNTSGSVLILDFAREIPISEEYYAPSSLGQFQLLYNVTVNNNTGANINSGDYELVTVLMNSGVFSTERGASGVFTALLTKQDVLDASQDETSRMSYSSARRLVGGKIDVLGMLKSALPHGAKVAKALLEQSSDPRAKTAAKVIGALGYGRSGGRMENHLM